MSRSGIQAAVLHELAGREVGKGTGLLLAAVILRRLCVRAVLLCCSLRLLFSVHQGFILSCQGVSCLS